MNTNHIISLIAAIKYKADKYIVEQLNMNGIVGLVPSHGEILSSLFNHKSLTMKQIADKIDRDKSTVTTLIKKLIDLGYIKRESGINDKREVYISLTSKGKSFEPIFNQISSNVIGKAYFEFSHEEKESLINLLEKSYKNW